MTTCTFGHTSRVLELTSIILWVQDEVLCKMLLYCDAIGTKAEETWSQFKRNLSLARLFKVSNYVMRREKDFLGK